MNRRACLTAVTGAGIIATAGCSAVSGGRTLSEPAVTAESAGRKALIFTSSGEEVANFGVDGDRTAPNWIELSTRIWHRAETNVKSITLRVWMPEIASTSPAEVAVVSPVEGDSSPPPSVALYTPDRSLGTAIEVTELDDLADETISTLDLIVKPGTETATTVTIHATIELSGRDILGRDYTLDGELQLEYPERTGE